MPHSSPSRLEERPLSPSKLKDCHDILMNAPIGIFVSSREGRFIDANLALARLYGYDSTTELIDSITNIATQTYVDPLDRETFKQQLEEHGELISYECRQRRKDGSIFWASESARAIRDDNGTITHYNGFTADITDRKQAEKKVRENESQIKSIFRSAPIGIGVVVNRVIKQVNLRLSQITGYSTEELLGQSARMFYQSDADYSFVGQEKYNQIHDHLTGTAETQWLRKDGAVIDVLLSSTPINPTDLSKGVTFTALDITDRKQSERALQKSEEKLANYANQMEQFSLSAASMISLKDDNRIFARISKAIVDYSDFKRVLISLFKDEAPYRDLIGYAGIPTDIVDRLRQISLPKSWYDKVFSQGLHLGQCSYYIPHTMKDILNQEATVYGESAPPEVESAWHPEDNLFVRLNGENGEFIGVISVDDAKSGEKPTLETVRPLEIYAGMIAQIIILKREHAKREKLESQLRQAMKMESVGRLAGGVAHDFNNMLAVILGHAEMAIDQIDPTQPIWTDLQQIRQAATHSADITRQLLAFARKQTIVPKVLDLSETVAGMLKMLHRLIGENIDLAWLPGYDLWPTKIDPSQIDQILVNLCINARDAIENNGKITVETGNSILDRKYCDNHPGSVPGEYVRITVNDNGSGIEKETIAHIFEPFFTTKDVGEGTGLGLATVYGIVKQNKGFINVDSTAGQGTTFTIYLPRYLGTTQQKQPKTSVEPDLRGDETLLLVENESTILNMTRAMLQNLGYTVLAAGTPDEVSQIAEKYPSKIDLLLTDIIMPKMDGRTLAEKLEIHRPDMKCLYMSGYTSDVISHHAVLSDGVSFIQKPFTKKQLADKIREVLK